VYPNPAGSYTNVNSKKYPILEVNLYDVTGKLLQQVQTASGQASVKLNTTDLLNGVYILRVTTTTGVYRQKLLKQ
jgi:Secretion system C-terminal sorting domain